MLRWFLSLCVAMSLLSAPSTQAVPAATLTIYDNALATSWADWSWDTTVNFNNTSPVHGGNRSIAVTYTAAWAGLYLRAAPSIGGLVTTYLLALAPIARRVGLRMFQSVIVFGVATVVFGVSSNLWLSLAALVVMGAADQISVVIRLSLVQLATPDDMRGRVSAVNFLFVNASNQLGEFESGVTAAWWGAVPAVIVGGLGSIVVALLWMRLFPTLRDVEKLS